MEGGRINIQYRRVECTPPEPLKVNIHANVGEGGWLRIAVEARWSDSHAGVTPMPASAKWPLCWRHCRSALGRLHACAMSTSSLLAGKHFATRSAGSLCLKCVLQADACGPILRVEVALT